MKQAAEPMKRGPVSRAEHMMHMRRRLAFIRELERRLEERTAELDAYRPAPNGR